MKKPTTLYRFLTGPDDASFCHKITNALDQGWKLYGDPVYTSDAKTGNMKCGQAVTKLTSQTYDPNRKLGEY